MKLVVVFMLAALPLYCYAGSGCQLLEDLVGKTLDSSVSTDDYREVLKDYIDNPLDELAVNELKECFLSQSNETLANVGVMMESIYNSYWYSYYVWYTNFVFLETTLERKVLISFGNVGSKIHLDQA
ncbi:mammaglobin-A-like [Ochotona curzoniae]|uniref:mammaglobin-A-like n=1 Tax=Ochotona curzoniae TaxID=130825 RepID=UPI001B349BA8|nr:mammaglobin-A-like [Ochotona curzoniae]